MNISTVGSSTRRPTVITTILSLFLLLLAVAPGVAALSPELQEQLLSSGRVTLDLVERLDQEKQVSVQILFSIPGKEGELLTNQSHVPEEVDPVVVDLVQYLVPNNMSLANLGVVRVLRGAINAQALAALVEHPNVVVVDLDLSAPLAESDDLRIIAGASGSCIPSGNRACVQGGRFSLQVAQGGGFKPVVSQNGVSAVFSFFGTSNWEVLAKVLDGCAINNRYWVFGAGATNQGYALHVVDTVTGSSIAFNGAICPIANTSFFPCS